MDGGRGRKAGKIRRLSEQQRRTQPPEREVPFKEEKVHRSNESNVLRHEYGSGAGSRGAHCSSIEIKE